MRAYLFAHVLIYAVGSTSDAPNRPDHTRAALAALTGGGASDRGGAGALGRLGRKGGAYRIRSGVLKLDVVLVCEGARWHGLRNSSE
jgi:hypothetical protein